MKFTIIVATYNRAQKVRRCVEGVLAQTHKDFELLVVDDGSTDDTREVLQPFLADARVRFVELGKNHGNATAARNTGIEMMTGDGVIIWDSDDELYPHALSELAQGHAAHPEAVCVCANTDWVWGEGSTEGKHAESADHMLTYVDWYCGRRPKEAEIISVLRGAIGKARFKSRGIDYMFFNEILGTTKGDVYYIQRPCGKVYLESDALSLTIARRRPNTRLSIERGPIIADHLEKFGGIYKQHCPEKYAAYAYGASVGLLLGGDSRKGRTLARDAARHDTSPGYRAFYWFSLLPYSSVLLRWGFSLKGMFANTR